MKQKKEKKIESIEETGINLMNQQDTHISWKSWSMNFFLEKDNINRSNYYIVD